MTKKKKVLTAGAAFAVAAAALTPVASVDAAQKRVIELAPMTFTGGEVKLPAKVGSSKITWYKSGIDMKKVNTWQTIKGYAGTKKVPTTIKIKIVNYVVGFQQSVAPQEVEVDGKLVLPAKLKANFAVGAYYVNVDWEEAKTDKAGDYEVKGTYTRDGKTITVVAKYSVVDADLKIENVSSSVDQAAQVLSVNADVKNLKDGEKVELVVFAGRDMNAPLPAVQAEVKEGKLTVKSAKLPAGNHSFILRSGEVKTDAVNFTVEAPEVKEVKAINGMTLQVKFNKELNEASAETIGNYVLGGSALVGTAELGTDKKTVTITFTEANKLAVNTPKILKIDNITTVTGSTVEKYEEIFTFSDSNAASISSVEYPTNSTAKISFSEPMGVIATGDVKVFDGNTEVTGAFLGANTTAGATSLTINTASLTLNKTYTVKIYNAKDIYGNFGGTLTTTVTKATQDTTKPEVVSAESLDLDTVKVNFSEKVIVDPSLAANGYGDITIGSLTTKMVVGANVASVTPSADGKSVTVELTPAGKTAAGITTDGLQTVSVNNYFDASGNQQTTAWTKVVNFTADTAAPTVASTEVSGNKLYVTFNENVTLSTASDDFTAVKYVKNYVEYTPASATESFVAYDPDGDGSTKTIELDLGALSYAEGNYTVTLAGAVVKDASNNNNAATTLTFNYVPSTSTAKPQVVDGDSNALTGATGIVQSGNSVTVTFDKDVEAASALDLNNYLVDGVPVFEKAIFVGNQKTVRLTLKANSVNASAAYLFTVQNVKSSAGVAMDKVVFTQTLTENVAPTVSSATLTAADEVTVAFSEAVTGVAAADFELFVGGTKVGTISGVTGAGTSYVLTLPTTLTATDLTKDIQIKVVSGAAIVDANSNAVVENVLVTVSK